MKKSILILLAAALTAACGGPKTANTETVGFKPLNYTAEQLGAMSFDDIFTGIEPSEIPGNPFDLVGKDFTVITAGAPGAHNSMLAAWGGWGMLFGKPTTWNMINADRYTFEFIQREQKFTMAYFDDDQKGQIMLFGTQSGRDTEKMTESTLIPVATPGGSTAFKEAKLIIECTLTEITEVSADDFYAAEGRETIQRVHDEAGKWHNVVCGEITGVWVRK